MALEICDITEYFLQFTCTNKSHFYPNFCHYKMPEGPILLVEII